MCAITSASSAEPLTTRPAVSTASEASPGSGTEAMAQTHKQRERLLEQITVYTDSPVYVTNLRLVDLFKLYSDTGSELYQILLIQAKQIVLKWSAPLGCLVQ